MSVTAKHIADGYRFIFTCAQWSVMEQDDIDLWQVVENTCGYVQDFGSPFATLQLSGGTLGLIEAEQPIFVETVEGVITISIAEADADSAGSMSALDYQKAQTYLEPVSLNTTSANIPAGAVSSISVVTALFDKEYRTGDVFSVINNANGERVKLTVTADVTAGSFTISASGTAATAIPSGAVLVPIYSKRNIYTAGAGISIVGDVITNASPDQVVSLTSGTGISVSGTYPNFTITNAAPDQTVTLTQGANITITGTYPNFTIAASGGGVTDGDKGDVVVSGGGTVWTVDTNVITDAKIRQSAGLSVVGRSANSTGDVADIVAASDAHVLRRSGTSLGFGQVATAGISDGAVTLVKLQNSAGANILLGNNAAAGSAYVELTAAQVQTMLGYVDGTGVANRIAFWSDANTLSNDVAFVVDPTNDRVTITGTVVGTGSGNALLNLNTGILAGDMEFFRAEGNISAEMIGVIANARNVGSSGNTKFVLQVGGTSAGDPFLLFSVPGGTSHVLGIDNTDADKLKITPGGTSPGSIANKGVIVTTDAATRVGINVDAPTDQLHVSGAARALQFFGTGNAWSSTIGVHINFGVGAGAGGSLAINSISGSVNWFQITFTTGNAPTSNGIILTATYPTAFPNITYPVFSARNNNAATDITKFYISSGGANSLELKANGTLSANTLYALTFNTGSYRS